MSLHFACRSATHRLSGRVLKASREVIRGRRLTSEAETTSTAAVAKAPVVVGKGVSWESVAKDVVRNGGASFVAFAGLLVAITTKVGETNANIEKYFGETNTNTEKLSNKIKVTNMNIEKYFGETNANIEKLSSETKASMAELRHEIRDGIRDLDKNMNTKVDRQTVSLLFAIIGMHVVIAAAPLLLTRSG
jgi:IMP dehydrogenase/GMP reductase